MTALWLVVGVMTLLYSVGCRRGVPALDVGPKPPAAHGTITGIVHGAGDMALAGRTVEVVNVATGEKLTATTAPNGGFTIEVPEGRYRLDLPLRGGEMLLKHPSVVDLDRGDVDSHIEFVVSQAHALHRPSYRLDNGLGSPMA
jgi:hypothetical protein